MKSAFLFLSAAFAMAACTASTQAPETSADEEIKLGHAEGYFQLRPDLRRCVSPLCGGAWVKSVNAEKTTCLDGTKAAECYVANVDVTALGLSDDLAGEVAGGGDSLVLRGALADKTYGTFGNLGFFRATEAWRAPVAADAPAPTGASFYLVNLGPADGLQETLLGSKHANDLGRLSLASAPGTDDDKTQAEGQIRAPGLIVLGTHAYTQPKGNGLVLLGAQYFERVTAAPQGTALTGTWGGKHVQLSVDANGASLDFDCASGSFGPVTLDAHGGFTAQGTFLRGSGVQPPPGLEPKPESVTYQGKVTGHKLALDIVTASGTSSYQLELNKPAQIFRCL